MDSDVQREMFIVKIETDVAEEPPIAWRTKNYKQEPAEEEQPTDDTETCGAKWTVHDCENIKAERGIQMTRINESQVGEDDCEGHPPASDRNTPSPLDRCFVCQHCSTAFIQFNSLKVHLASCHGETLQAMSLESSRVGCCFVDRGDRTDDELTVDKSASRHVCDVCGKAFTSASGMRRHQRTHTGHRPFACDECSKAFAQISDLRKHKIIHVGAKPFVCDACGKAFARFSDLVRHKKIHTGQKPFVCDVCEKTFSRSATLSEHKRIHADWRASVCDVCNKVFNTRTGLSNHKRVHTGDKPTEVFVSPGT